MRNNPAIIHIRTNNGIVTPSIIGSLLLFLLSSEDEFVESSLRLLVSLVLHFLSDAHNSELPVILVFKSQYTI